MKHREDKWLFQKDMVWELEFTAPELVSTSLLLSHTADSEVATTISLPGDPEQLSIGHLT